jgi:iron complex outermembrane receptor protein
MPPPIDLFLGFARLYSVPNGKRTYLSIPAKYLEVLFCLSLLIIPGIISAQTDSAESFASLKELSLEELMNVTVTSVSKTPEKLSEVASAIQVINGEDIRRSGASRLPDALRLATNLQVAQVNSYDWAITARGFNGASTSAASLANKLLVMIDGRSVYTPLFGGVFWDVQNVLLEDVQQIEVVSGPGGTLWGANAVNGVINVISKSSRETQGLYATGGLGTFSRDQGAVRYGGHAGSKVFYRVYGQFADRTNTMRFDTIEYNDDYNMIQGGFRMDYYPSEKNTITLQGDLYGGKEGDYPLINTLNGQNVLGRWTHTFSETSDLSFQVYFDRTWRHLIPSGLIDHVKTYDADFQHRFKLGKRQTILWGGNFRYHADKVERGTLKAFYQPHEDLFLITGFVQDQISLVKDKLALTIGTKLLSNYYSGFEYQPTGRLAYTPNIHHTIWAAVSRAIRGPSRFDIELTPDSEFKSENLMAYELGYRVEPFQRLSLSFAGFYNRYTDVRNLNDPTVGAPLSVFGNDQRAKTWGIEFSSRYVITDWWRLRVGYTYLGKKFEATTAAVVIGSDAFEGMDPRHQFMLQSIVDITDMFDLDAVFRLVDSIPGSVLTKNINVPLYPSLDIRLAYTFKHWEFAVIGQDLLQKKHTEYQFNQIPRSVYAKITVRI